MVARLLLFESFFNINFGSEFVNIGKIQLLELQMKIVCILISEVNSEQINSDKWFSK